MAFSLRNRSGWNRLWIVLAVLWWGCIAIAYLEDYPRRAELDRKYEYDLEQVTRPESQSLSSILGVTDTSDDPRPPSQALIDKRRYEAMSAYAHAIDQLPHRQHQFLLQAGVAALAPFAVYAILYLLVGIVLWIIRGFRQPSSPT